MYLDAASAALKSVVVSCGVLANLLSPSCNVSFPHYPFTGQPLGLIDAHGKVIASTNYSRIQYLSRGFYLCQSVDQGAVPGDRYDLLNHNGKKLLVTVPKDTFFSGVYSLGQPQQSCETVENLPKDAVLIFRRDGLLGLCTTSGAELLPAKYKCIDSVNGGQPLIFDKPVRGTYADRENGISVEDARAMLSQKTYYFDIARTQLVPLAQTGIFAIAQEYSDGMRSFCSAKTKGNHGFMDGKGNVVIQPRYIRCEPFEKGRAIVTLYPGPSHSQFGERFVIDKNDRRLSPKGIFVHSRWNGVYNAYLAGWKKAGLLDENFKWLYGPVEGSRMSPQPYGSFLDCGTAAWYVVSNTGHVIKTLSVKNTKPTDMNLVCVPKYPGQSTTTDLSTFPGWRLVSGYFHYFDDQMPYSSSYGTGNSGYEGLVPITTDIAISARPYVIYAKCENDRFIMANFNYDGQFDPLVWKGQWNAKISRPQLFARFLHDFDLIGMDKEMVMKQLSGDASMERSVDKDCLLLSFVSGGCTADDYVSLEIHFKDDKVKSWNFVGGNNTRSSSITENVLLVPKSGSP